jgi:HEAT repeat protein
MKSRYILLPLSGIVILALFAVLIPASPIYLEKIINWDSFSNGHSTGYWMGDLENSDAKVRREAIHNLGRLGAGAGEAVPALGAILLEDTDPNNRREAALALSKMAPASRAAVSALAQALEDKELFVRRNATVALLALGEEARPAVPALIRALKDKTNRTNLDEFTFTIQQTMALTLGEASAGSSEAVPALLEALKAAEDSLEMRLCAARGLGAIGPPAQPAVPQLRTLLKDQSSDVRKAAGEALEKIGSKK